MIPHPSPTWISRVIASSPSQTVQPGRHLGPLSRTHSCSREVQLLLRLLTPMNPPAQSVFDGLSIRTMGISAERDSNQVAAYSTVPINIIPNW